MFGERFRHDVMSSRPKPPHLSAVRRSLHGRPLRWLGAREDEQHYALINDDSGIRLGEEADDPATAVRLVGVYSHAGNCYS